MRDPGKMLRVAREVMGDEPNVDRFTELLSRGWEIEHEKGTAFVSMKHPSGGAFSLCEVKVYGTPLTTGEADSIAAVIAEKLKDHYAIGSKGLVD